MEQVFFFSRWACPQLTQRSTDLAARPHVRPNGRVHRRRPPARRQAASSRSAGPRSSSTASRPVLAPAWTSSTSWRFDGSSTILRPRRYVSTWPRPSCTPCLADIPAFRSLEAIGRLVPAVPDAAVRLRLKEVVNYAASRLAVKGNLHKQCRLGLEIPPRIIPGRWSARPRSASPGTTCGSRWWTTSNRPTAKLAQVSCSTSNGLFFLSALSTRLTGAWQGNSADHRHVPSAPG